MRLKKKWFNPGYFEFDKYLLDPKVTTIYYYGGKSASKTVGVCQALGKEAQDKNRSTIAFRKEGTRIKKTLKKSFNFALSSIKVKHAFDCQDFLYKHLDKVNESGDPVEIVMSGLETADKVKGIESFTYCLFDELDHFSRADWVQADLSLRGRDNQKRIGTFNPISEEHWINKEEFDFENKEWIDVEHTLPSPDSWIKISPDGMTVIIKTDYRDNFWIVGSPCGTYGRVDEAVIAKYEKLKYEDPDYYKVNVLGEWGQLANNRPFFPTMRKNCFSRFDLFEGYNLYLAFDFNIDVCACTMFQMVEDEAIYIHRCWGVYGGITQLCKTIMRDIPNLQDFMVVITGDSSGKNGSAYAGIDPKTGEKYNLYNIISNELDIPFTKRNFKINNANKEHFMSYTLCSEVLANIPVIFHTDYAIDLWTEMFNAQLEDRIDRIKLFKDKKHMNDRVDSFRYGLDILFPNQIGKEGKRGSVKYLEALIRENRPEMVEWYQSLAKAHSVQAA